LYQNGNNEYLLPKWDGLRGDYHVQSGSSDGIGWHEEF